MSFQFNWPKFDKEFIDDIKKSLTTVLNQGKQPLTIADRITVIDLSPGNQVRWSSLLYIFSICVDIGDVQAPDIEVLEVSGMSTDTFKALFKIRYDGDAYLTFRTKVQVIIKLIMQFTL